jgi:integrase
LEAALRNNRRSRVSAERRLRLRRQGRVRALVYRFVGRTGLVRIGALDLANGVLSVSVGLAKSRRRQEVMLGADMIRRLKAYLRTLGPVQPTDRLYPGAVPGKYTFERDLAAAGIPKEDAQGRVFNLHALRKTLVTHLRMTGADPDIARRFARHAARDLTHGVYTDETLLPLREAIDRLRVREAQVKRAMRARREAGGA